MVYLRAKNDIFETEEVSLHNLHIYKDYVILPYIEKAVIYDAFLDAKFLSKEK